jgi:hypothetical protein
MRHRLPTMACSAASLRAPGDVALSHAPGATQRQRNQDASNHLCLDDMCVRPARPCAAREAEV